MLLPSQIRVTSRVARSIRSLLPTLQSPSLARRQKVQWRQFSISQVAGAKKNFKKDNSSPSNENGNADTTVFDQKAMQKTCDYLVAMLQSQLKDIEHGRRRTNTLSQLRVQPENVSLAALASVVLKNPKLFVITVFDPQHVKQVSSTIASAGMNFNPQPVPDNPTQLTISIPQESVFEVSYKVKVMGDNTEKTRILLRNLRIATLKKIAAEAQSKNEQRAYEKAAKRVAEQAGKEVDGVLAAAKKSIGGY